MTNYTGPYQLNKTTCLDQVYYLNQTFSPLPSNTQREAAIITLDSYEDPEMIKVEIVGISPGAILYQEDGFQQIISLSIDKELPSSTEKVSCFLEMDFINVTS